MNETLQEWLCVALGIVCGAVFGVFGAQYYAETEYRRIRAENLELKSQLDAMRRGEMSRGSRVELPRIKLREPVPEW